MGPAIYDEDSNISDYIIYIIITANFWIYYPLVKIMKDRLNSDKSSSKVNFIVSSSVF